MSMPGMPGKPQSSRVIAYIDGFNLYHGLRDEGWQRYLWLDLPVLSSLLIRKEQKLLLTKYFTTRISSPESKRARQSDYLDALNVHCGGSIRMYWGHYQSESSRCNSCGAIESISKEKKTDVNIAVEMMTDAFTDAFDTAVVVTADSDLVPPVLAIRRLFPRKSVVVAFPPSRFSAELQQSASACFTIGRAKFAAAQLPPEVQDQSGIVLKCPVKWSAAQTAFGTTLDAALKRQLR